MTNEAQGLPQDAPAAETMKEVQRRLDAFHSPSFDREIVEKLLAGYHAQAAEIAGLRSRLDLELDAYAKDSDMAALRERLASAMEALTGLTKLRKATEADVATAHQTRTGASEWMREDDRDFRRDLATAFNDADALLSSLKGSAE
jgi:hypothetical protein